MGQFYYAAKAFDVLERLDPNPEYWEGKRGACVGVFQLIIAGHEQRWADHLSPASWFMLSHAARDCQSDVRQCEDSVWWWVTFSLMKPAWPHSFAFADFWAYISVILSPCNLLFWVYILILFQTSHTFYRTHMNGMGKSLLFRGQNCCVGQVL